MVICAKFPVNEVGSSLRLCIMKICTVYLWESIDLKDFIQTWIAFHYIQVYPLKTIEVEEEAEALAEAMADVLEDNGAIKINSD